MRGLPPAAALLMALALQAQVPNDECATAIPVTEGLVAGNNAAATTSPEATPCNPSWPSMPNHDVWYLYTPSCSAVARASLLPADGGSVSYSFGTLAAFTGTCAGGLTKIACAGQVFIQPRIDFPVTAGVPIYLEVGATGPGGAFVMSIQCFTPAANDDCANAIPIAEGTTSGSTFQATTTPGLSLAACSPFGANYADDVWFEYVPTATGMSLISTCPCDGGSQSTNVLLLAYGGTCTSLVPLGCAMSGLFGSQARFFIPVVAGVPVKIAVAPFQTFPLAFDLVIVNYPAPTNDDCAAAAVLADGVTTANNFGATTSGAPSLCPAPKEDVWFVYTPSCSGVATFSLCPSDGASVAFQNPFIAAFSGGCGALSPISCSWSGCSPWVMNSAKVTVPATSGVPIYLSIGSALAGQEGPFQLFAGCSPAQANDSCTGAIPVVMGVNGPFDDLMASDGGSPPNASGCVGPTWMFQNDVWFSWTSPVTGGVRIDTCGATYNAHVLVFDACGGTQVACALFDGATCAGGGSFLTLAAVQGQSYRIRVDGLLPLVSGQFHLRITGPYTLVLDAPSPGKVRMSSHSGTPLLPYFSAVTAVPGAFPNGAFYGIDVQTQELLAEWAMGFPFAGTLDANGDSTPFILSGVPPGLVFHAVSVTYDAATLAVIDVTAPVTFTTS